MEQFSGFKLAPKPALSCICFEFLRFEMSFIDREVREPTHSDSKLLRTRTMKTRNPLDKNATRALFKTYFGSRFLKRLAPVLGVSPNTIANWLHANFRVRPVYYRRLAAFTPKAHKDIDEWTERRIERIRAWNVRKHAELDQAQRTLLWAAEAATRAEGPEHAPELTEAPEKTFRQTRKNSRQA